ncbi:MAG: helix-turn-helix domain-containing protein [Lachnospiraceae bacterium]|nr:helix-turn-helix domain-containing protein [Lachnospiraceae bacterium]
MQAQEQLYTVKEVAEILKTGVNYVYKLKNAGLLRFLVIGRLKCRKSELERFLSEYEGYDITDPFNIKPIDKEGTYETEENAHNN